MATPTIAGILRTRAAEQPDKPAVIHGGHIVTYGDLDRRSNRFARALLAEGLGPDDRVALLDKNTPQFFDALFGTSKAGAVLAPVNWRLAPVEAAVVVNDCEAKVLVVGEELLPLLDEMRPELTSIKKVVVIGTDDRFESYEEWLARHDDADPGYKQGPDDVALQFYSSGTTGRPKGVMLTNRNLFSSVEANNDALGFDDDSVTLVVMPLFHVAGGAWALIGFYNGTPNVLLRDVDPVGISRAIEQHRVTHAVLVPVVMQFMLTVPDCLEADYSSLRTLVYGASPISEEVLRGAISLFDCAFLQAYGMTETTGGIAVLPPEDHDPDGPNAHRLRAAGKAAPGSEVRVVDPASLEDRPVGEVGEVLVRSPQNMKGYWRMPEATAATILDGGWLRTGDAGYLDADGYLYIHDRVKDMIISGGENIYPAEIENALMAHAGIADAAVIGVPHDKWGETPKALVVGAPGAELTEDEVIAHCRGRLAGYKCPTSVDFVEALPRNPSGKVLKIELRAPYWEGRDRRVN